MSCTAAAETATSRDSQGYESLMQYRKFGKLDWKVSALGFGAMRLPLTGSDPSGVDVPEAVRLIRHAIDHGINYLDTAYPYHSGQSEKVVGQALQEGYRKKVKLATKLPARRVQSAADFDRIFDEQLERLQTERVDFYLLHGLNRQRWPKLRDLGVLHWAEAQMARGRFDYLGFSFHDGFDVFKGIVDTYDNWTLCQVLYNYMDVAYQAGTPGVEYAANRGLAVVAMEPLRGGALSGEPPEEVAKIWAGASKDLSPVEWALRWVCNHPGVSTVLSGMSTMGQLVDNIGIASRCRPGTLTPGDLAVVAKVRDVYGVLSPIPCSNCGYCLPCSSGVQIPDIFKIYNETKTCGDLKMGRHRYSGPGGLEGDQRADRCTECGECLDACPQEIPITGWLKKAHELFSEGGSLLP